MTPLSPVLLLAQASDLLTDIAPRQWMLLAATVLGGLGLWLMLPRGIARGRRLGMLFGLIALGLIGGLTARLGGWLAEGMFSGLAVATVVSAAATVTARNPVYSAIWFALVLLGTAGLFLCQGAQFLGIATVVVYAGAILVTFLFVLMLAQPDGHAYYDRISWEALLSAATGAVLIGMLTNTIGSALDPDADFVAPQAIALAADEPDSGVLAPDHVAGFGGELFSRHLISVEVAGALLLAALVGAIAIVGYGKQNQ